MTDFAHCLTPEEFTLLLNLFPVICKRGGFNISEYKDIIPIYEKMQGVARSHPKLFKFDDDTEAREVEGPNDETKKEEPPPATEESESVTESALEDAENDGDADEKEEDQEDGEGNNADGAKAHVADKIGQEIAALRQRIRELRQTAEST